MQDLLSPKADEALPLEITRLEAYYHLPPFLDSLEVTARMLSAHHVRHPGSDWLDLEEMVSAGSGLTLDQVLAISILAGLNSSKSQANYRWPPPVGADFDLTTEQLVSWAGLWSITIEEVRDRASRELEESDWSIGSLVARPFIDFGMGRFVVVRPADVKRLCSPVGIRALLERLASASGVRREEVGPYWGQLLDDAGRQIASETETETRRYLSEDAIRRRVGATHEVCDGALLEAETCLCFDFTVSGLGVMALTGSGQEDFWADHDSAIRHKIGQLDSVIARLPELQSRTLVAPLIVTGGILPWTPFVASWIDDIVQSDAPFLASQPEGVLPIRVVSVAGLRALIAASDRSGKELATIVQDWVNSDLGATSLRIYLRSIGERGPSYDQATRLIRSVGGGRGSVPMQPSPWEGNDE